MKLLRSIVLYPNHDAASGYRWELSWMDSDGEATTIDCHDDAHALEEIRTLLESWSQK